MPSPKRSHSKGHRSSSSRSNRGTNGGGSRSSSSTNGSVTLCPRAPDPAIDPVLCSFPGGLPAALQSEKSMEDARIPNFRIGKHGADKIVKGKDHACEYTGILSSRPAKNSSSRRPMQMCVGIYDKQTQQLILQPTADQGFVYAMAQSVPDYLEHNEEEKQPALTAAETRQALFGDFGSAKKRKVMRSQEANRVNVESVVGAGKMSSILENMSESNRQAVLADQQDPDDQGDKLLSAADQATLTWRKQFLPDYDEHAEQPANVYSPKKIAGPAAWGRLWNRVTKCLEQDNVLAAIVQGPPPKQQQDDATATPTTPERERRADEWYPSVVRLLKMLAPKGQAAKQQLVCAILLNHFLHLYVQLHKKRWIGGTDGSDRPRFYGTPMDVGQQWVERFTTPMAGRDGQMGHVMSKANKDSCCVHLFLLLLMAEGGPRMRSESIQELAADLQMDARDASHLLRLAGCTVKGVTKGSTAAVLTTPLKFPSLKKAKRS